MKSIVARLKEQLRDKGLSARKAHSVAIQTLQDSGSLYRGTEELTAKGKARTAMGAKGRAIDRAVQRSGRDPAKYVYSKKTNRATLK